VSQREGAFDQPGRAPPRLHRGLVHGCRGFNCRKESRQFKETPLRLQPHQDLVWKDGLVFGEEASLAKHREFFRCRFWAKTIRAICVLSPPRKPNSSPCCSTENATTAISTLSERPVKSQSSANLVPMKYHGFDASTCSQNQYCPFKQVKAHTPAFTKRRVASAQLNEAMQQIRDGKSWITAKRGPGQRSWTAGIGERVGQAICAAEPRADVGQIDITKRWMVTAKYE
jgi:hypothetical protein